MKANGSRRKEREEKISRKKSGASPGRCREKNSRASRRWAGGAVAQRWGGGGGRCGAGRARAGWRVGRVGTLRSRSLGRAAPLAPTPAAPRALITCPLRLYMSKVLKSVLPIATARVLPQPISEPDPTRTPLRVSKPERLRVCDLLFRRDQQRALRKVYFGSVKFVEWSARLGCTSRGHEWPPSAARRRRVALRSPLSTLDKNNKQINRPDRAKDFCAKFARLRFFKRIRIRRSTAVMFCINVRKFR